MYQFNPYAIPPFFTTIFVLAVGFFVFNKNKKAMSNITFGLLYLSSAIWQFGFAMEYLSIDKEIALFWHRFVYLGVVFITPTMYHFSVSFLNLKKQKKWVYLFYVLAFVFLLLSRTDLFISGVRKYFWGYYAKVDILHHPFLVIWSIPAIYAMVNLYKGYKATSLPLERQRRRFMFLSLAISLIGSIDYLPAYGIPLYPFGYLPVILCQTVFAYAMTKYRLMDIRIAITRTGIFVAVYTLVLGVPFLLITRLKEQLISILGLNWWILPLALMTIFGTVGPFIYIYLDRKAEKRLLREQYRYQETLKQAAREIARIRNLKKLLNLIVHLVTKTVHIYHSVIYLFDEKSQKFILMASRNLMKGQQNIIDEKNPVVGWFQFQREPLLYEEIKQKIEVDSVFKGLEEQMRFLNASVIVPGFLEGRLLGLLLLGEKRLGKTYTQEDLNTFSVLASQAALAIENALIYGNIEEQVRKRTKELVEMQNQLIQAEKLATVGTLAGGVAHEINNPLTAILTNAQMLLATTNSLDVDSKESLELIEEATKRCRIIVQKLMAYAKKPLETTQVSEVDMLDVIKKVTSFLSYQLEQENIKIIIESARDSHLVMGNHNELEQVVTNIILNARDAIRQIKKNGAITISLTETGRWIEMKIKDEGCGMPKEIISKVFDPFFTTKEVGKGTGLGLSICQSIVEKHNGVITVQSEPNQGSVFTVRFPKAKISEGLVKETLDKM